MDHFNLRNTVKNINTYNIYIILSVEITINKRIVTVTGKRGTLVRDFNHLRLDMTVFNDGTQVLVEKWFGTKKELAAIRTVCTHIKNMFIGVTKVNFYNYCSILLVNFLL